MALIKIPEKRRLACDAYLSGLNKSQALLHAGYSKGTGTPAIYIFDDPLCVEYMKQRRALNRKKLRYTRDTVAAGIESAIQQAVALEEPNTQINGWREIGRLFGLYEPEKKQVTISQDHKQLIEQVENAPLEELMEIAEAEVIEGDFELL